MSQIERLSIVCGFMRNHSDTRPALIIQAAIDRYSQVACDSYEHIQRPHFYVNGKAYWIYPLMAHIC